MFFWFHGTDSELKTFVIFLTYYWLSIILQCDNKNVVHESQNEWSYPEIGKAEKFVSLLKLLLLICLVFLRILVEFTITNNAIYAEKYYHIMEVYQTVSILYTWLYTWARVMLLFVILRQHNNCTMCYILI